MDEFTKKINLFKLIFEGDKKLYEYRDIPSGEGENTFTRKGDKYYSLKKFSNYDEIEFFPRIIHKLIENSFRSKLEANSYNFNRKFTIYKNDNEIRHSPRTKDIYSLFKGFEYRFISIGNDMFLNLDYKLIIKIKASIQELLELGASDNILRGNIVEFEHDNDKNIGKLAEISNEGICKVYYNGSILDVDSNNLYLLCRPEVLRHILRSIDRFEDVVILQRRNSIFKSERRLFEINKIVKDLNENIFPLLIEGLEVKLHEYPLALEEIGYYDEGANYYDGFTLKCGDKLNEPELQFDEGTSSGLQPFPTTQPPFKKINDLSLIFYYPESKENDIKILSDGIEGYLKDYFFVEDLEIQLHSIRNEPMDAEYTNEILNSIKFNKINTGLIYIPEIMKYYQNSPYYKLKIYFASQGIPTQMITDKSFQKSSYRYNFTWLNICTAILAKCGGIPWVLKKEMKETDIIIGMSLSARLSDIGEDIQRNRFIGFANIFNKYGKWMYLCGTANKYSKGQEVDQIEDIIHEIVDYYSRSTHPLPKNIMIHNSRRFRKRSQEKIYELIADEFGKDSKCAFIAIDESHNLRCFDSNSSDGSLARGIFIYLNNREILLSTTGPSKLSGAFRQGTPKMLHITTDQFPKKFLSLEDISHQVLSLTKLNWASVNPAQREPVTIKYANRLAYIAANVGLDQWNTVNDQLFNKPWFI